MEEIEMDGNGQQSKLGQLGLCWSSDVKKLDSYSIYSHLVNIYIYICFNFNGMEYNVSYKLTRTSKPQRVVAYVLDRSLQLSNQIMSASSFYERRAWSSIIHRSVSNLIISRAAGQPTFIDFYTDQFQKINTK